MANVNSKLRKINKGFVDKIKEDSRTNPHNVGGKKGEDYLKDTGVQPLTFKDQFLKGGNIEVKFINNSLMKNLNTMQLAIFINGDLKYTSKKGVFAITTIKYSTLRRKGWRLYCENVEKDKITFKNKKDFENFLGFCTKLRDCGRVQDLFSDLCYSFIADFDKTVTKDIAE